MIGDGRAMQNLEKETNEVEERKQVYEYETGEITIQVEELGRITELLVLTVNTLEKRLEFILANDDSKDPKRGLEQHETVLGNALSDKIVHLQVVGDRLNNIIGRIRL